MLEAAAGEVRPMMMLEAAAGEDSTRDQIRGAQLPICCLGRSAMREDARDTGPATCRHHVTVRRAGPARCADALLRGGHTTDCTRLH
eukprot:3557552-Prymnesium_polylepis.1